MGAKGQPKTGGKVKGSKHKKTLEQEETLRIIRAKLTAELEPILEALIAECKDGETSAIKEALNRVAGKSRDEIDINITKKVILLEE